MADNKSVRKRRDPKTGRFTAEDETISSWWGRRVRPALRSPLAADLKQIFELLGIPLGILALGLTGWQIFQANIQMEQSTKVEIEQRLDTARAIVFDEGIALHERFRAFGILASSGGRISPPAMQCSIAECDPIYGFRIDPSSPNLGSILEDWRVKGTSFVNLDWTRVWTFASEWKDVRVTESTFRATSFIQGNFEGAKFVGSRFIDSEFRESNLANTDFSGSDLTNATFVRSDVSGMELCNAIRNGTEDCAIFDGERTFANAYYVDFNPPKGRDGLLDDAKFGFVCPADMTWEVIVGAKDLATIGCEAL